MAVNNCAGATLLAAAALAGASARSSSRAGSWWRSAAASAIPEVIAQAGARLVEVGTTNRTRRADYERALGERTGAILRAHPSNFRQLGFVQEVEIEELCELGVPVIDDVGSGVLADDLAAARGRAAGPPLRGRGRGARVLLRGQAARRARRRGCSSAARTRSPARGRIRWRGRCGSTSSGWPRWRRRCGSTSTRSGRGARSPCWRCSPRPRTSWRDGRRGWRR